MPDYRRLYHLMFNAVTDALTRLDASDQKEARRILLRAQQDAEHQYLSDESCEPAVKLIK